MMVLAPLWSAFFLLLAATLRASGSALFKIPRADALRAAEEHQRGARQVALLLERHDQIVPAVGVVHSALLITAVIPATWWLSQWDSLPWVLQTFLVVGLALVLVILGDLLPRRIGRSRPKGWAFNWAFLLRAALWLGNKATDILADLTPLEEEEIPEDETEASELKLISSVMEFSDTLVREVMIPRTDMVAVERTSTVYDVLDLMEQKGFSRFPVVGNDIDDVLGLVIIKDLLPTRLDGPHPDSIEPLMREMVFVPETKRVSDLLREMQAQQTHMAAVVDEFGGIAGLVTIEDLLEELVGEIADEYDQEDPLLVVEQDGIWLVDGRLPVQDLADTVGVELPTEDWDTVGGLVLGLAGRVPEIGEKYKVDPLQLEVTNIQGKRVLRVRASLPVGTAIEPSY